MNPLELYLSRVARELRSMPSVKRDEELRELRSHLEQRIEDFEARGLKIEDAQARAVDGFGSPQVLGSKLCDAWEGISFSWWRAVIGVTLFWFGANLVLIFALFGLSFWPQRALLPEAPYAFIVASSGVPFYCGTLFSRWLGRRGRLATLLYFLSLFVAMKFTPSINWITGDAFSIPLPIYNTALALGGAIVGYALQKRSRLAKAGGGSVELNPTQLKRAAFSWRRFWLNGAVLMALGLAVWARVQWALHPTTPSGVLRASLLTQSGMNYDFEPATILGMRELPAQTPAERAGTEKRMWFKVEVRATKNYAARRVAYYQKELASPRERKSWGEKPLRLSLARAQRNRQIVQGVARLIKTPNGWQVDRDSFSTNRFGAWLYDVYYER